MNASYASMHACVHACMRARTACLFALSREILRWALPALKARTQHRSQSRDSVLRMLSAWSAGGPGHPRS